MIHVLILCKEKENLSILAESISKCMNNSLCIISTTDINEAVEFIEKQQIIFDMFIISVQLENRSGYIIEKLIRQYRVYAQVPVLFITKESYDLVGFSKLTTYQAYKKYNYLSLPLDKIDVQSKINLYLDSIMDRQEQNEFHNHHINLKGSDGLKKILLKDILYLEIQNKICSIHTYDTWHEIKRTSLSKVLTDINDVHFIRCHRYFAVNIKNIDFIERQNSKIYFIHFLDSDLICPASKLYLDKILPLLF